VNKIAFFTFIQYKKASRAKLCGSFFVAAELLFDVSDRKNRKKEVG